MLNYIEQINFFWRKHEEHSIGTVAGMLYFHLLDVSNKQNWRNPFKRQNTRICGDLGITNPTLLKARNELKQYGLIDFVSKGKGDSNVRYEINNNTNNDKYLHTSFNTSFTTPFPSSYDLSKTEEEKKIVIIEYERALDFFLKTKNCRLLSEKHHFDELQITDRFKIFYDSKVDLGEFNNKSQEDMVRHFSMWLPIYLQATKKTRSDAGNGKLKGITDLKDKYNEI